MPITKADLLKEYQKELDSLKNTFTIKTRRNLYSDILILKFLESQIEKIEDDQEKQILIRNFFLDIFLVFGIKIAKTKLEKLGTINLESLTSEFLENYDDKKIKEEHQEIYFESYQGGKTKTKAISFEVNLVNKNLYDTILESMESFDETDFENGDSIISQYLELDSRKNLDDIPVGTLLYVHEGLGIDFFGFQFSENIRIGFRLRDNRILDISRTILENKWSKVTSEYQKRKELKNFSESFLTPAYVITKVKALSLKKENELYTQEPFKNKIGGQIPFFMDGEEWPRCGYRNCQRPMTFYGQFKDPVKRLGTIRIFFCPDTTNKTHPAFNFDSDKQISSITQIDTSLKPIQIKPPQETRFLDCFQITGWGKCLELESPTNIISIMKEEFKEEHNLLYRFGIKEYQEYETLIVDDLEHIVYSYFDDNIDNSNLQPFTGIKFHGTPYSYSEVNQYSRPNLQLGYNKINGKDIFPNLFGSIQIYRNNNGLEYSFEQFEEKEEDDPKEEDESEEK